MKTLFLNGSDRLSRADLRAAGTLPADVIAAAQAIVDDVRERGDEAVRAYTLRFDGSCPDSFRVPDDAIAAARASVSPEFLAALEHAAAQIREFHAHELERERSWTYERANGVRLGVRVLPVSSAAIYVPGGRAQYPSTVLMDCIPAKVAGVGRVIILTPPQ
ncbi:MAG: histidinol dehydrogenase, partial [Atopobiaceae bacterium]|nr:histidinol dehydrogenase [Atopobiaceae bacterium]